MSNNILRRISRALNLVFFDSPIIKDPSIILGKIIFGTLVACGHSVYTFSTTQTDNIQVVKKYKMNRNGFTDFMIIDDKGRHFNINNSVWFWKWNSIEDWHKIEEKKELPIKYYGWRYPIFGLFPNIVSLDRGEHCSFNDNVVKHLIKLA